MTNNSIVEEHVLWAYTQPLKFKQEAEEHILMLD